MTAALAVRDVRLRLGELVVLDGVTFAVEPRIRADRGQIVGLLGPSGVGKTQLLRVLAGLRPPDAGEVLGPSGGPFAPGQVGVVFQSYPLLAHRTVRSNLVVAGQVVGMPTARANARADELLTRFGLEDRADYYPAQLSGGQRQRVAIAQQIAHPDTLLLMDEPFSGLDPAALAVVQQLIAEVAHTQDRNTVLIVTHDVRAALAVSDVIVVLGRDRDERGRVVSGAKVQATWELTERAPKDEIEREICGRFPTL